MKGYRKLLDFLFYLNSVLYGPLAMGVDSNSQQTAYRTPLLVSLSARNILKYLLFH